MQPFVQEVAVVLAVLSLSPALAATLLRERNVAIEYTVQIRGVPPGARVAVWIPVPQTDANQTIGKIVWDLPQPSHLTSGRLTDGPAGNRFLHTVVSANATLRMRFDAIRRERIQSLALQPATKPDSGPACCTGPDRLVPVDGRIRQWAREVVEAAGAKTDFEMARAIYDHVVATVRYDKSGKGWGRGDIYYACDARRGNCSDFHAIFIGYSRALGIPARFAIGVPLPAKPETDTPGGGSIAGYHCWAEFYAKGIGWIPVDASEAAKDPSRREYFFGAHDENRVEFSRGRDVILSPPQQGSPLNFFVYAYAELDGKPFDGVETAIAFRDLPSNFVLGRLGLAEADALPQPLVQEIHADLHHRVEPARP